MLPFPYRLKEGWRIRRVLARGEARRAGTFILYFSPGGRRDKMPAGEKKFAFIASKKIGKSVKRNRATRVLRGVVYDYLPNFPVGFDYVVVARRNVLSVGYDLVRSELQQILSKI